jgi:hypothetical protein
MLENSKINLVNCLKLLVLKLNLLNYVEIRCCHSLHLYWDVDSVGPLTAFPTTTTPTTTTTTFYKSVTDRSQNLRGSNAAQPPAPIQTFQPTELHPPQNFL